MRLSKARKACLTAMMKDSIFDAAGSLLEQQGTDGLTMNRVAKKVGVAAGSLYNYFRDKDDLLRFFYTRLVEPCFREMEATAVAEMPVPQKLQKILRTALEYAVKHKGILRLLVGMEYDSQVREAVRPHLMQIFVALFEQGIKEGVFRCNDATDSARMLIGCLSELCYLRASGGSDADVSRFTETLIDAVLSAFFVHREESSNAGKVSLCLSSPERPI